MEELHLAFLAFSALVILWSDHLGFLYFIGKKQTLPLNQLKWSHRLVWLGLLGMIGSGALLLLPAWEFYLQDPVFLTKMAFVLVLVINGFAIGFLLPIATKVPFTQLPNSKKFLLGLSGAASATGWIGAALIGFFWL